MITNTKILDMNTINDSVSAVYVGGFRLFLRNNIYSNDAVSDELVSSISNALYGSIPMKCSSTSMYFTLPKPIDVASRDTYIAYIIDAVRSVIIAHTDAVLYNINYLMNLNQNQKDAYKKILYSIGKSRKYFELLLNISFMNTDISVML